MAESNGLVELVQTRLDGFLAARSSILLSIAPDLAPILDFSRDFLSAGKRFRAQFCYRGWQCIEGTTSGPSGSAEAVVGAAGALEVFHAAALIHDDLIDRSDTRRGAPSVHKRFESLHSAGHWRGSPVGYGASAALLLGDLLLGWSDELLDEALTQLADRQAAAAARAEFVRMRTEVTAGQYLDILEESAWAVQADAELRGRAERVIVYKSAKYSVEAPLLIGASLAGARDDQLTALRKFGLPLGVAYQLRDDLLGVFGDARVTGKPSGDDLREGKRTVLVALAREQLSPTDRLELDTLLGDPQLTGDQVRMLQETIRRSGAVDRMEALIRENAGRAVAAIDEAPVTATGRAELRTLADRVTQRTA